MSHRQFARHHPLGQLETAADGGIEALADQVHLAIIEMPVRVDRRITSQKFTQQRYDKQSAERRAHAHLQRPCRLPSGAGQRSEEHTSELQSLMRISYAVFCLKKKKKKP